jgi:methyltransferase (TIGR00027 family)
MTTLRIDSGTPSPLFEISWEEDRKFRTNPEVLSALLCEQVPVLDFVKWKVTSVEPGWTESVLPLNPQSTNQHFTHQAALFLLAADYTGGTALGSLLTGWPVVGVHPVCSPKSVSLWLLKAEVKYMRPSVNDLTISARVDVESHERIRKRFLAGKAVLETINIQFRNGDILVGEANATYFARQSSKLRSEGISTDNVNSLYELKLTSSAELIAGVRAHEQGKLFQDPYAAHMAGQHGMALAKRFCERSPQLGGMVSARTWHLDTAIKNFLASGGRDVVILGVGWDMRPFRMDLPDGTRVYELDFPTTLAERRKRLNQLGIVDPKGVERISIPIDVRTMPLAPVLAEHLDTSRPVFIAWEGMSMYFQEEEVQGILQGMLPLLKNRDSLLWLDLVDRLAVEHPEEFPESVQNFMRGMQILGEPFTFGSDAPKDFMQEAGFRSLEVVSSDVCLHGRKDPVYSVYKFCVASSESTANGKLPSTFQQTRVDRQTRGPAQPHVRRDKGLESPRIRASMQAEAKPRQNPA